MRHHFLMILVVGSLTVHAQTFSSGSNGSDGALAFTTAGTFDFDPVALGKDSDGDNVFHFTTITIGPGVTLRLRNGLLRGQAVVWLATGAVQIGGTLDLSGEAGHQGTNLSSIRVPAQPGPGGYAGGLGTTPLGGATPGFGPGGGAAGIGGNLSTLAGVGGSHATPGVGASPSLVYGNSFLVPLRGGSGGGGGAGGGGSGGGAGGGAIRIASSVSLSLSGLISANGGTGGSGDGDRRGGGGAGGAVHLIAPTISGGGGIDISGGCCVGANGGGGRARVDAFNHQENIGGGGVTFGTPYNVPLPTNTPAIRVTSIGGVAVPPNPSGLFTVPDVVLSQTGAVTINIEARNVPVGTIAKLTLLSETDAERILDSTALAGTAALSTATVTTTISLGYSRGFVRTTW